MIRRPPRSTRTTHSFPTRRSSDLPEVALIMDSAGEAVGATLGNDVNLRDFEGRSALLLGKAKDNNASAALGPFIRLFDDGFTIDDVRNAEIDLRIEGTDGYLLTGKNQMGPKGPTPPYPPAQPPTEPP